MDGIYQPSTPSIQTKAPKPLNSSSKRTKKPRLTKQLFGKEGIEMQEKCKTPGDNYTSTSPRPIIFHSQNHYGTINSTTSTKEIAPKSGRNSLTEPPSMTWPPLNKLMVAIDAAEETTQSQNSSLPPLGPSMETMSDSDSDVVEETQIAEYYYDGETQPFILATADTNASPTPSNEETQATNCEYYHDGENQSTPIYPKRFSATGDGNECPTPPTEEAHTAEYYYDGETQPFSIPPTQILAMADTNVNPTPSNQPSLLEPENPTDTKKTIIVNIPKKSENRKNKNKNKSEEERKEEEKENNNNKETNSRTSSNVHRDIPSDAGDGDCPTPPAPVKSLRANDSSAKNKFRVYSHNVNGLRDESKLEHIPRLMQQKNIDAYLIQETHLAGDFEKFLINDYYIIHHGPETQPVNGKRGGVAIFLSPDLHLQWKLSGKGKKIIKGGTTVGDTTRILSISMRFELTSSTNKGTKKKNNTNSSFSNLCLTTIYFPHSGYKENEIEMFNTEVSSYLANILSRRNTTHIIGADTNASIGNRLSISCEENTQQKNDEYEFDSIHELLGPFGNPRISKTGKGILNIMREFQLRAVSSFFDNNNKYNTWLAPPQSATEARKAYQLDQFFIPKNQLCQTTNLKRRFDGATSDHAALLIEFHLLNGPLLKKRPPKSDGMPIKKIDNNALRNKHAGLFKTKVDEYFNNLSEKVTFLTPSELLENFEDHITTAARDVAASEVKSRPDWFTEAEEDLLNLIEKRNDAFKKYMKHPTEENHQLLKQTRHALLS